MTGQLTSLTLILTFCMTDHGQSNRSKENQNKQTKTIYIDTSEFVILPFETTLNWVFKDSKPTELTNDDLLKIETIFNKCMNAYNLDKNNLKIELGRYNRQYVAAENSKGKKEVWINCFCREWDINNRKQIVSVLDGGNCYFNLKINLTKGEYYELMVNGDA